MYHLQVKAVNYIRKQIHTSRCVYCDANIDDPIAHMNEQNHFRLPNKTVWDQLE